jgi:predicted transcriptional regulator
MNATKKTNVSTTIRFKPDLYKKLKQTSETTDQKISTIIDHACRKFLGLKFTTLTEFKGE